MGWNSTSAGRYFDSLGGCDCKYYRSRKKLEWDSQSLTLNEEFVHGLVFDKSYIVKLDV